MHRGNVENESTGRIFAGLIAAGGLLYRCGDQKRKYLGTSAYSNLQYSFWLCGRNGVSVENCDAFCCVEIRKLGCLVLAVLILAETGIHGIVSITDNGTANRDIYVESEQEVCGFLESAGVDR